MNRDLPAPIRDYLAALERELAGVPRAARADCLREVESHLRDACMHGEGPLGMRAREAVAAFGPVAEVAPALRAEATLAHAARGFRPAALARGLLFSFAGGLNWLLLGLLFSAAYLALLGVAVATVARLFNPDVGLWLHEGGSWSVSLHGFENARQIGGAWWPVAGAAVCMAGWWLLNRALHWLLARQALREPGRA